MKRFILFIFMITSLFAKEAKTPNYLIVLSMDGFRNQYIQDHNTPNFDNIAKIGVKSVIVPAFPSKTFPNHYTLATGLYPDHHGLIFNTFYDYKNNRWYKVSNRDAVEDGSFYGGEPIWSTAELQGLKSATLFWVGSEAAINGIQPTYWKKYQHEMPFENRIDTVISWLKKPKSQRPRLIMWYLHEPDSWGHKYGPDHKIMAEKIEYLDKFYGSFHERLKTLSIYDSINVILTSDHGMGKIDKKRVVYFDDYLQKSWINKDNGSNPVWMFEPKENFTDSILIHLQNVDHINVWKKEDIPDNLHYGTNNNIMPIVVVADSAWSIGWKSPFHKNSYTGGTHGYKPSNKDMHAIFYAFGPDFKSNYRYEKFENIHLYSLMAKLLNLKPAENDGNYEAVKRMLK